jgi:hypothetical protein
MAAGWWPVRKSAPRPGMFGRSDRNGVQHLYPMRFRNEEELVKTLGHERIHIWQVKTDGYPDEDALARRLEDAAKATEAQARRPTLACPSEHGSC